MGSGTTPELNYHKRTEHQSKSLGSGLNQGQGCKIFNSKSVVKSPPSSSTSLGLVENDAFGASLGPTTPDSNRESVDYHLGSISPMSLPAKVLCFGSHHKDDYCYSFNKGSPSTPRNDVFDSFAPGPDNLVLAPYCRKYAEESRFTVARQLKLEPCSKFTTNNNCKTQDKINAMEDEMLFQAVYLTIMEAIISMQTEEIAKVSDSDGSETPTCAPHLSRVADICPHAPVKPKNKIWSIAKEICRRLEF